eukprot:709612-Amphidinium_carterae.2
MNWVRALGLPAYVKARIVKSFHSVGLYGAEFGGIIPRKECPTFVPAPDVGPSVTYVSWPIVLDDLCAKWDSAQVLCAKVAATRADFEGLAARRSTASFRQLKLDGQSQKEERKAALKPFKWVIFVSGVEKRWRTLSTVHRCPRWHKKRRGCFRRRHPAHEGALVPRQRVDTVWTDGSGRRSRRCQGSPGAPARLQTTQGEA